MTNNAINIVLKNKLNDYNNLTQFHEELVKNGMNISYHVLYGYVAGTIIPPYENWIELNKKLKLGYTEDELLSIFELSKQIYRENEESAFNSLCKMNVRIKADTIDEKYYRNVEYLKHDIEQRAEELFTDESLVEKFKVSGNKKIGSYISYLIEKDFKENGII